MNFERVKVNFGVLEKSIRSLEKSWKSPGKLFLKKGTNPDLTSMAYLFTAVSVCGLEEIFLELQTCLLVFKVTCSLIYVIVP